MRTSVAVKCMELAKRYQGYIYTSELLKEGITNRQIARLTEDHTLERICHGIYWLNCSGYQKPKEYKAVEIAKSNPNAVVCADSACFYQGLISVEPPVFSVATKRSDRRKIKMNFPVARHYYSEPYFSECQRMINTNFGSYVIYDIEKSVCDCIRFKQEIEEDIFCLIIESYKKQKDTKDRIWKYAERLRMINQIKKYL